MGYCVKGTGVDVRKKHPVEDTLYHHSAAV